MWGHLHYGMGSACAWVGLGWVQVAVFTAVIWTRLKQMFHITATPNVSPVCYASRPQLCVPDSRWCTKESKSCWALLQSWPEFSMGNWPEFSMGKFPFWTILPGMKKICELHTSCWMCRQEKKKLHPLMYGPTKMRQCLCNLKDLLGDIQKLYLPYQLFFSKDRESSFLCHHSVNWKLPWIFAHRITQTV